MWAQEQLEAAPGKADEVIYAFCHSGLNNGLRAQLGLNNESHSLYRGETITGATSRRTHTILSEFPYLILAATLVGVEQTLEVRREPIVSLNENRSSGIDFPLELLEAVRAMQHQLREGGGGGICRCQLRKQAPGSSGLFAGNQCSGIPLVSVVSAGSALLAESAIHPVVTS